MSKAQGILTDLLYGCVMRMSNPVEPEVGDWCCEVSSWDKNNCDFQIGILKQKISDNEFITVTIDGREVHWRNAALVKIPDNYLREQYRNRVWPEEDKATYADSAGELE